MKHRQVVPNATRQILEIYEFILLGNESAADLYYSTAYSIFEQVQDTPMHRQASEQLPEFVREMQVPGFRGYTLRIAYVDDKIGLIAAFRPGLTDVMKNRRTHTGLRELNHGQD